MLQPGRQYSAGTGYRYGFNGKENDNEVKGEGNQQDYGMRIYDPRLGRFLSVDPLSRQFPDLSAYHFAGNGPIRNIDIDGGEPGDYRNARQYAAIIDKQTGQRYMSWTTDDPCLGVINFTAVYDKTTKQHYFVTEKFGVPYYWKADPGQDQTERIIKGNTSNGSWQTYETAEALRSRVRSESVDFLSTFFAVNLGGAMASGGAFYTWVAEETLEELSGYQITPWRASDFMEKEAKQAEFVNPNHSSANYEKLKGRLRAEELSSSFNPDGTLTNEAISKSVPIVNGTQLGNTELKKKLVKDGSKIADWNKMSYAIKQQTAAGQKTIDIHFYYNKTTNKTYFDEDYKSNVSSNYFDQTSKPKQK